MDDKRRQMLNLRVIRGSFRAAAASQPAELGPVIGRAMDLLAAARDGASPEVLEAIAAIEAEIEGLAVMAGRRA